MSDSDSSPVVRPAVPDLVLNDARETTTFGPTTFVSLRSTLRLRRPLKLQRVDPAQGDIPASDAPATSPIDTDSGNG